MTTFIVNLRHLLYSSTLATYLMGKSRKYLGLFAQGITDETFAMNLNQFTAQGNTWDPPRALGLNILAHGCWIFSNMLGNIVGNIIVIDTAIVSYTLTAMFIGLVSAYIGSYLGGFISANGRFTFSGDWTPLVVVAVSAAVMALFVYLAEKKNMAWLESFSIAGSMLIGMAAAVLVRL